MVQRELRTSDLSDAILVDLIGYDDPLGVLSVYAEMPADDADCRAEIEIKDKLERIVERALHTGARITPVDGSAADNLADSRDPGREPAGWTEAVWPVPGSLLARIASYFYGARRQRLADEDDR